MAASFLDDDDMVEQIVIRLEVEDLLRCKSVCKSWYSLITSSGFINRHLTRNYEEDRHNNVLGHRRLINLVDNSLDYYFDEDADDGVYYARDYCNWVKTDRYELFHCHGVVGCSNGLVCISDFCYSLFVRNMFTREVSQLLLPSPIRVPISWENGCYRDPSYIRMPALCWGFGYDSSIDDYKIILGSQECENDHQTCVQVFSLKTDDKWRVVGKVKYKFMSKDGILCNGALHWIVTDDDKNTKRLIVSYDLSKEEFKEIPRPNESASLNRLGIVRGCLCLYNDQDLYADKWLMKNYDSWELLPHDPKLKYDTTVHYLIIPAGGTPIGRTFDYLRFSKASIYHRHPYSILRGRHAYSILSAPVFVKSLVSPYRNERRKQLAINTS